MSRTPTRGNPNEFLRADDRLRELELQIVRRLDGMLQGDYRGLFLGPGTEAGDGRRYQPGDDVRRMDWKLTARLSEPHIRDSVADRELELWVVLDQSASLWFGTRTRLKWDLALAATAAVGFLTARGGNRVGCVGFGAGPVRVLPARSGRDGVLRLLHELDRAHGPSDPTPDDSTLEDALDRVRRVARHRGLVAIVSDFMIGPDWGRALRGMRAGFEIVAFEVLDPRELELPAVGMLAVVDPETGRRLEVQTANPKLRARFASLAQSQRAGIAASLRQAGADHVVLRTDADWLVEVARFVRRRRRALPVAGDPGRRA